jgi:hypothetical protein
MDIDSDEYNNYIHINSNELYLNNKNNKNNFEIDDSFNSFVFNKRYKDLENFEKEKNSNSNLYLIEKENLNFNYENNKSKKIKIEILDILEFILITFKENDTVNIEISKFIIDILDIFIYKRESEEILNKTEKICKKKL